MFIECDENQHKNYVKECEDGRIDELLDEVKSGRCVIIRYNPDYYKCSKTEKRKTQKERLKMLENLILQLKYKTDWKDDETIIVYYMFYDVDNPLITSRWKSNMIY